MTAKATLYPDLPPARNGEHLYWVDWLRFLSALLVVLDHTRNFNWMPWETVSGTAHPVALCLFLSVTLLGRQAVVVFFVLSGLLVGGKILARVRQGTFDPASYAADRLSRIYVPLLPALLLTAAVTAGYGGNLYPWDYLGCLAGFQTAFTDLPRVNGPVWTLAYEVWFYVLGGCAGAACLRGWPTGKRLAAGAGAAVALAMLCGGLNPTYLACWLLGAGGFALRDRIRRGHGPLAALGGLMAVAGMAAYQMDVYVLPPLPPALARWQPSLDGAQFLEAAGVLLCVACLIQMPPRTRGAAWVERQGTRLAAFSYTLYLTHMPLLYMLGGWGRQMPPVVTIPSLGRALAWLAGVAVGVWMLYWLFETRTPAVRRWLRERFQTMGEPRQRPNQVPQPNTPKGASVPACTRASI